MIKIETGSTVFFSKFSDYIKHDIDYTIFDDNISSFTQILQGEEDLHMHRIMNKDEFIKDCLECKDEKPTYFVLLLTPTIQKYFDITIEDIKNLNSAGIFNEKFKHIYARWLYYKIILDAYLENNSLEITDEQLNNAYIIYKLFRHDRYSLNIDRILCGSSSLFSKFSDYHISDLDYVIFDDKICDLLQFAKYDKENCIFLVNVTYYEESETLIHEEYRIYNKMSKDEYINYLKYIVDNIKKNQYIIYVPNIARYFNMTIDDIKDYAMYTKNKKFTTKNWKKYLYYNVILNAYLKNNSLEITDKQLKDVYVIYKLYRSAYNGHITAYI